LFVCCISCVRVSCFIRLLCSSRLIAFGAHRDRERETFRGVCASGVVGNSTGEREFFCFFSIHEGERERENKVIDKVGLITCFVLKERILLTKC